MERSHLPFVAALALAAVAVTRADQPTFSSRIEAVRLDVLVTENGRTVRGLTAKDFDIIDNGVPQTADLDSFEEIPLNVILALDASSSVVGQRLDDLRDAGRATGGRLYEVGSTRDLRRVFLAALEEFRQRYLVSYSPHGVAADGWHRVEVNVKGRRAAVRARPGYLATPP